MKIVSRHPLQGISPEELNLLALIGHYTVLESSQSAEISRYNEMRFALDPESSNYEEKKADCEKAIENIQRRKNALSDSKTAVLESLQIVKNSQFAKLMKEQLDKK